MINRILGLDISKLNRLKCVCSLWKILKGALQVSIPLFRLGTCAVVREGSWTFQTVCI